jgi:F-type H+-transporting ATPase subunit a
LAVSPASPLATTVAVQIGPVPISRTVVTTWGIMAVLTVGSWLSTRRLKVDAGRWQTAVEVVVLTIRDQIGQTLRRDGTPYVPLLGTLFLFLVFANLSAIIPGVSPPTAHIETPAALAVIVFVAVHGFGIAGRGPWRYLKSYAEPSPVMIPLNIASEITRTFSLMVRLFGNIMSHEIVIAVVVSLVGIFAPIPFMALAVLIGIVQAYIFTILATVFLGAAVGSTERS